MNDAQERHESNVPNHEPADNRIEQGIRSFTDRVSDLFRQGNRRRFQLKNSQGKALFSLPLTVAVLIGLLLLWRAPLLVLIAVVVALVLKTQFVLTRERDGELAEPHGE